MERKETYIMKTDGSIEVIVEMVESTQPSVEQEILDKEALLLQIYQELQTLKDSQPD